MKKLFFLLLIPISTLFSFNFSITPDIFSPNESPGEKDKVAIGGYMEKEVPIYVEIFDSSNNLVRTIEQGELNYREGDIAERGYWYGKDNSGNYLEDGSYTIQIKTFIEYLWHKGNDNRDLRYLFESPYDACSDEEGNVYVIDKGCIKVYDSNGNYLKKIEYDDFGWPVSIEYYNNRLYILDVGYGEQNIKIFNKDGTFYKSFGTTGNGDGQFNCDWKNNFVIDNNGRIWIVDSGNSRIQVFNSEGNFLFKFGSEGTGEGQFNFSANVGNIAVDANGNVYITDDGDNNRGRIQIFDSNGNYLRSIKPYPEGPIQLLIIKSPIAVDSENKIYVSSGNNNKVIILNNDGSYYGEIGENGCGRNKEEFSFISKIRFSNGKIYITECYDNLRVQIFDTNGNFLSQLGMKKGEFLKPLGIWVYNNRIYVADADNHRIQIFDTDGDFLSQILIPYDSQTNYFLLFPVKVYVDSSDIYVGGEMNNAGYIYTFDLNGNLLKEMGLKDGNGNAVHFKSFVIDDSNIFVVGYTDYGDKKVYVYDLDGNYQRCFGNLDFENSDYVGISEYQDKIFINDENGIEIYQKDGSYIKTIDGVDSGSDMFIDSEGYIYLAGDHYIKVYTQEGNLKYSFGRTVDLEDEVFKSHSLYVNGNDIYFTDTWYHRIWKVSKGADINYGNFNCTIDNTKPEVSITYPPHNQTITPDSDFYLKGTVKDTNFDLYKVYRNGESIGTFYNEVENDNLCAVEISGLDEGLYHLSVLAQDKAGNTNTDEVKFFIDSTPPSSCVNPLPAYTKNTTFEVSWSGNDTGSGISCYDIQYKDGDDGEWKDWLTETTLTSATFNGEKGHKYYFRSRAKDNAGIWEEYGSYDTYTVVDTEKPYMINATPSDYAYVGANPSIIIELYDPEIGSGIDENSISVKLDGENLNYTFSNNKIYLNPTFQKGLRTITIDFSDKAGNQADTVTLHYNALSFEGTVERLNPDPNPDVSEVMAGGRVYRYYKVIDNSGNPAEGVSVKVEWNNGSNYANSESSDANGIVRVVLDSDELGNPGDIVTCSITEAGGNSLNTPISFQVQIVKRKSYGNYKFGSGINLKAAIGVGGKVGSKKGFTYTIIEENPSSSSDDEICIGRSKEGELGVIASASIGGGVENNVYAEAGAEIGVSAIFMYENGFLFTNPYNSDEEKILRGGLIVASLLESMNYPLVSDLLSFVIDTYNPFYEKYKDYEKFTMGVRVEGGASAGAGLGIGDDENVLLGIGIGLGISGEAEILGEMAFDYTYENGLNLEGTSAGLSFYGNLDIFGGAQLGLIGDTLKLGIGGNIAGKYEMKIYSDSDGNITKGEITFWGEKNWGVGTSFPDVGETKKTTLIITSDQLEELAGEIADIVQLEKFLSDEDTTDTCLLGPTEIEEKLQRICEKLQNFNVQYKVEVEKGKSFSFSPSLTLALGAKINVGVDFEIEKSISYTEEEGIINGIFGERMPFTSYSEDSHIVDLDDLSFSDVFDDCVDAIVTAMENVGNLAEQVVEQVGDTVVSGYNWVSEQIGDFLGKEYKKKMGTLEDKNGLNEMFAFTPEGKNISDLSSQINSEITLNDENCSLTITPGENKALVTIKYNDSGISETLENNLKIYMWNSVNRKWIPAENSKVDKNLNEVSGYVYKLGVYRLGIPVPYGDIKLNLTPKTVDLNSPQNIVVTSEEIKDTDGNVVEDGTFITVNVSEKITGGNFGNIITQDQDSSTEGIQIATNNGRINFEISPPAEEGTGKIIVQSVDGTAKGSETFVVINNPDTDSDNLPDYWEKYYFGDLSQEAETDFDNDGLTNLEEYQNNTNPKEDDTENDGTPDGWEVNYNLNPLLYDSNFDNDNDGYTNLQEYQAGTDPKNKNSYPGAHLGDINGNTQVDISDVILCLRMAIGLDPVNLTLADMNDDGTVDISDVILVLRKAIGLD